MPVIYKETEKMEKVSNGLADTVLDHHPERQFVYTTAIFVFLVNWVVNLSADRLIFAVIPLGWTIAGIVTTDPLKYYVAAGWVMLSLIIRAVYVFTLFMTSLISTLFKRWQRKTGKEYPYCIV